MKLKRYELLCLGLLLIGGCRSELSGNTTACSPFVPCTTGTGGGGGGGSGGAGAGAGGGTDLEVLGSPFLLTLESYWYSDQAQAYPIPLSIKKISGTSNLGTSADLDQNTPCIIDKNVTFNSAQAARNIECGVEIPETQLWFSSLKFKIRTPAGLDEDERCDVIYFYPYFYRVSNLNAQGFTPFWAPGGVDCSTMTNGAFPIGCYSGPATHLVPGFPQNVGLHHIPLTDGALTISWTANSAYTSSRLDNRWTGYRSDGGGTPGTTVGATQDWEFQCVKTGSNLQYSYLLRIYPVPDNPLTPGAPRRRGWLEDDGVTSRANVSH